MRDGRMTIPESASTIGSAFLIPGTIELLLACMEKSSVRPNEVPDLIQDVHSVLLEAVQAGQRLEISSPSTGDETSGNDFDFGGLVEGLGASLRALGALADVSQPASEKIPTLSGDQYIFPAEPELPLETEPHESVLEEAVEERQAAPQLQLRLPRRLKSIDEALQMDFIVCLEDGRKIRNLAEHLATIGMTPDDYRQKWGLPKEYPMHAPSSIIKRGSTYEVDYVTGKMIPVR